MKVIKRQQVTEVVTNRQVSHTLQLGNTIYHRYETIKTIMPYMDCEIIVGTPVVKWSVTVGDRVSRDLSKKEVKDLMLEYTFEQIDVNNKNGNG